MHVPGNTRCRVILYHKTVVPYRYLLHKKNEFSKRISLLPDLIIAEVYYLDRRSRQHNVERSCLIAEQRDFCITIRAILMSQYITK